MGGRLYLRVIDTCLYRFYLQLQVQLTRRNHMGGRPFVFTRICTVLPAIRILAHLHSAITWMEDSSSPCLHVVVRLYLQLEFQLTCIV